MGASSQCAFTSMCLLQRRAPASGTPAARPTVAAAPAAGAPPPPPAATAAPPPAAPAAAAETRRASPERVYVSEPVDASEPAATRRKIYDKVDAPYSNELINIVPMRQRILEASVRHTSPAILHGGAHTPCGMHGHSPVTLTALCLAQPPATSNRQLRESPPVSCGCRLGTADSASWTSSTHVSDLGHGSSLAGGSLASRRLVDSSRSCDQ